jgi:hypothetical protein
VDFPVFLKYSNIFMRDPTPRVPKHFTHGVSVIMNRY